MTNTLRSEGACESVCRSVGPFGSTWPYAWWVSIVMVLERRWNEESPASPTDRRDRGGHRPGIGDGFVRSRVSDQFGTSRHRG